MIMIEFIKVSSTAFYSEAIKRLQQRYGLEGVGFYFMALQQLAINHGWQPLSHLLALRYRGMPMRTIEEIVRTSGLFDINVDSIVTLADGVDNGISGFKESQFYKCKTTRPWEQYMDIPKYRPSRKLARIPADTSADTVADTSADTSAETSAETSVHAGHLFANANKGELDKELELERAHEHKFYQFMDHHCPHLALMPEPLTYDQYKRLKAHFAADDIRDVLIGMENRTDMNYRSAYLTAMRWLQNGKERS